MPLFKLIMYNIVVYDEVNLDGVSVYTLNLCWVFRVAKY